MLKFLLFSVLVTVCASRDTTKPRHFEVFGDCDQKQYVGNEKIFTLRIPLRESIQTVTFPKVKRNNSLTIVNFSFSTFPLCITIRQSF